MLAALPPPQLCEGVRWSWPACQHSHARALAHTHMHAHTCVHKTVHAVPQTQSSDSDDQESSDDMPWTQRQAHLQSVTAAPRLRAEVRSRICVHACAHVTGVCMHTHVVCVPVFVGGWVLVARNDMARDAMDPVAAKASFLCGPARIIPECACGIDAPICTNAEALVHHSLWN